MIILPLTLDLFELLQITLYAIFAILALSLAFIWGYGGILCFGHSAFFGLGAYTYAVAVINIGDSTAPFLLAMLLPALLAAALGYFMFYARISDIYVGVITLTLTLIFYNCINSTAGPAYHIGDALLGGFNGMPNIPSLNIPFLPDATLEPLGMFLLCSGLLLIVYFALHGLLATRFGRVLVAIRENEQRVEFLGYDARLHKLVAFAIGGALAGLAGCLYVAWGNYVSPPVFSVVQSAQIIIWLMVGGVGTLLGPVLGAMAISWLTVKIGTQQVVNAKCHSWRGFTRLRPVGAEGRRTDGERSPGPLAAQPAAATLGSAQDCAGGQGMSPPLIETRNLSKHFGGVQAVRNIDFSLAEGELRCLIGPNGAGKSTFFKLLTGQIKPTSGAVLFRGVDITKLQAHEIARLGIGIKTQVPSVFNGLTARQNLWIAAARHATRKEADAAVDAQIERLGLGRFADKPVGQLAHGQRQWVELALVLCGRPNLILLDEPAAGMTEEERVRTTEIIREINREHPLIVVEHDMSFIRTIARRITVFDRGTILMEGDVDQVFGSQAVRDVYLGKQAAA